jgi:hypothetical protein
MEPRSGWRAPRRAARYIILSAAVAGLVPGVAHAQGPLDPDTVEAGRFDNGKMWTFEYPPAEYFTETYGFEANDAWFERARMAALRIPGCSASFVSPNGLLATNHHCVRGVVSRVSGSGENLLDDGFYARTLEDERRIADYYADQLIAVRDVSDEVFAAESAAGPAGNRAAARQGALATIEQRLLAEHAGRGDSLWVQIVPLYNGGRYSAYVFRRYTDVRLVQAVELQTGFFGGDPDNFTYPRYALDFAFLRVYDANGAPYRTEHYFGWGTEGVESGDVVFVIGNPGQTNRLKTVAQLEFQRDVQVPALVRFLSTRLDALRAFQARHPAEGEALGIRNRAFGLSNSLKASTGRLEALNDPLIMARRGAAERDLRGAIQANAELREQHGALFDRLAAIQQEKRKLRTAFAAFAALGNATYGSRLVVRAMVARRLLDAPPDSAAAMREELLRIGDHPADMERSFLVARLSDLADAFGPDHAVTRAALPDGTPEASAASFLSHSALADSARTAAALERGMLTTSDPALRLVTAFLPAYDEYRAAVREIEREEADLESALGRARFAVYGRNVPPDGTFSPRITDGVVRGYEYNGTLAPPYTTFYGVYDRAYSQDLPDWDLSPRWATPPAELDLSTPLNFVSTADTYGGNSGSPAVTPALELVGLNFDRNIEGLSRDFVYLPDRGRNIMVDARAILAALEAVYEADRILEEIGAARR